MKLLNPKGKEVEIPDEKAKKILANPGKKKQGWKKIVVKKPTKKPTATKKVVNKTTAKNGQSNNKK
jgi:topoisomerase IA-like protein